MVVKGVQERPGSASSAEHAMLFSHPQIMHNGARPSEEEQREAETIRVDVHCVTRSEKYWTTPEQQEEKNLNAVNIGKSKKGKAGAAAQSGDMTKAARPSGTRFEVTTHYTGDVIASMKIRYLSKEKLKARGIWHVGKTRRKRKNNAASGAGAGGSSSSSAHNKRIRTTTVVPEVGKVVRVEQSKGGVCGKVMRVDHVHSTCVVKQQGINYEVKFADIVVNHATADAEEEQEEEEKEEKEESNKDSDIEVLSSDDEAVVAATQASAAATAAAAQPEAVTSAGSRSTRRCSTLVLQTADCKRHTFRMRGRDKIGSLYTAAAEKLGCEEDELILKLDGEVLAPEQTLLSCGIEALEEVVIDATLCGGGTSSSSSLSSSS
jgi:hypothetical protein